MEEPEARNISAPAGSPLRELLKNLLAAFAAIVIFLVILEAGLALFYPQKVTARPFFHIQSFFCMHDPVMGWVNKPLYRDIVKVGDGLSFMVTHNSRGLRGPEHGYDRSAGKARIVVLGDSFAWGFGVEDSEVFTSVMEKANPRIEAINMGVSGYGTDQELLYLSEEGYKYQPDAVVLLFYANDIGDISSTISYGYPKPMFDPESGPLRAVNLPVPKTTETERKLYGNPRTAFGKLKRFLRRHTHTYPFIAGRLNSVPWIRRVALRLGIGEEYAQGFAMGGVTYHKIDDYAKQWELFEKLVLEIRKMSAEMGAEFVLVAVPAKENSHGVTYAGVDRDSAVFNDETSGRLRDMASRERFQFIDLLPDIRSGSANGNHYFTDHPMDIHLSALGHKLMADELAVWLDRNSGSGR